MLSKNLKKWADRFQKDYIPGFVNSLERDRHTNKKTSEINFYIEKFAGGNLEKELFVLSFIEEKLLKANTFRYISEHISLTSSIELIINPNPVVRAKRSFEQLCKERLNVTIVPFTGFKYNYEYRQDFPTSSYTLDNNQFKADEIREKHLSLVNIIEEVSLTMYEELQLMLDSEMPFIHFTILSKNKLTNELLYREDLKCFKNGEIDCYSESNIDLSDIDFLSSKNVLLKEIKDNLAEVNKKLTQATATDLLNSIIFNTSYSHTKSIGKVFNPELSWCSNVGFTLNSAKVKENNNPLFFQYKTNDKVSTIIEKLSIDKSSNVSFKDYGTFGEEDTTYLLELSTGAKLYSDINTCKIEKSAINTFCLEAVTSLREGRK